VGRTREAAMEIAASNVERSKQDARRSGCQAAFFRMATFMTSPREIPAPFRQVIASA